MILEVGVASYLIDTPTNNDDVSTCFVSLVMGSDMGLGTRYGQTNTNLTRTDVLLPMGILCCCQLNTYKGYKLYHSFIPATNNSHQVSPSLVPHSLTLHTTPLHTSYQLHSITRYQ